MGKLVPERLSQSGFLPAAHHSILYGPNALPGANTTNNVKSVEDKKSETYHDITIVFKTNTHADMTADKITTTDNQFAFSRSVFVSE